MRTRTLAVALASALVLVSAGAGGAFAATGPLLAQQATTDTTTTTGGETPTTTGSTATTATTAGGASTTGDDSTTTGDTGPTITFEDQDSSGESVLVESATLPTDGFVVVNSTSGGTDQVVGSSYALNAGTSDNIRIQLDEPLTESTSLTAVLYADSNDNGQFDAESGNGSDQPVYQGDTDRRVVDIAEVSVSSGGAASATQASADGTATTAASTETESETGASTTEASAATETDAPTQAGSADTNASTNQDGGDTTGDSGPGFGLVVAVVALLAVALLVRRR